MKKSICMLMALLMLLLTAVPSMAAEVSFAEKMLRQLEDGSGLKGSLSFQISGPAEWAKYLSVFTGVDLQLRAIRNRPDDASYGQSAGEFQIQLYAQDADETPVNKTWIYGDTQILVLSTPLLPGQTLRASIYGDGFTGILGNETQNPLWYSALYGMMTQSADEISEYWEPQLAGYYSDIEIWLSSFATDTQVIQDETGRRFVKQVYTIPAEALKKEALTLLQKLFADHNLLYLLRKQLTAEQEQAYLNTFRFDYYQMVVEAIPLQDNAVLSRSVTTAGETVEIDISLPLTGFGKWKTFSMNQKNDITTYTLTADKDAVTVAWHEMPDNRMDASLIVSSADGENSWHLQAEWTEEKSKDADGKQHHRINVKASVDAKNTEDVEDANHWDMDAEFHFSGKNDQRSAVTLNILGTVTNGDNVIRTDCTFKTAAPWVFDQLDMNNGVWMTQLTDEQKLELAATFVQNAYKTLRSLTTAEIHDESTEATAEPMPEMEAIDAIDKTATIDTVETTEEMDTEEPAA